MHNISFSGHLGVGYTGLLTEYLVDGVHRTSTLRFGPPVAGAVILDVTCFAEAERLYMLARDTAVHGRPLTALVLPDVLVSD